MPKSSIDLTAARTALKKYFGYDAFHPTQEQAISAVLAGKDTFVLMPTGGGKSMCYQIPAVLLEGVTIVVSPLIALMKDQVDGLRANGVAAHYLNSSLDSSEQAAITQELLDGKVQILYVSAERLVSPEFAHILRRLKINLFAVDEAHCISAWGHDFRPDYTNLSHLKTRFPGVPIIALTATADQVTRADILSQLELDTPQQFIDSFDRPNISLSVLPGQKRIEQIGHFLQDKKNQSGIIYCLTRKETESLAEKLSTFGIDAASYHAGMSSHERSRIQKSFVLDKTQVICATIAFGMGIDKSNVRWVIHYNLPKNIEGYYQEIGRAGRDSAPANAVLFYSYADVEKIKRFFLDSSQSELQQAKLERMKEYAEGVICRRKILLGYFDESYPRKCQNCDVCTKPYPARNGTKLAQTVLQMVQKRSTANVLTTKDLVRSLLNVSETVNFASWNFYVAQLKNQGFISTDFARDQALSLTKAGEAALQKEKTIRLVTLDDFIQRQEKTKKASRFSRKRTTRSKKDYYKNPLFEKLRALRATLANEQSLAAYMVFSDATLLEMANEKPKNKAEMLDISGVGEVKWERYGKQFLEVIATG